MGQHIWFLILGADTQKYHTSIWEWVLFKEVHFWSTPIWPIDLYFIAHKLTSSDWTKSTKVSQFSRFYSHFFQSAYQRLKLMFTNHNSTYESKMMTYYKSCLKDENLFSSLFLHHGFNPIQLSSTPSPVQSDIFTVIPFYTFLFMSKWVHTVNYIDFKRKTGIYNKSKCHV